MEKNIQSSEYVNKSVPFIRKFEYSRDCSLSKFKNHSSGTTLKRDENEKEYLTSKFSFSPDEDIHIIKQKNEVINDAAPILENIAESTSSSAIRYHNNIDENTESCNVLEKVQNTVVEEIRYENEKLLSSPKTDDLTACIHAEKKTNYETTEKKPPENIKDGHRASFFMPSPVCYDGSIILGNGKDGTKQKAQSTEKALEDNFLPDFHHSVINKDTAAENDLKITMTEEYIRDQHGLLFSTDCTNLQSYKHKVIKEKSEITDGTSPTKVQVKEILSESTVLEHSDATIPVCKRKEIENTSNVIHVDYNMSFPSYINGSDDIYIEDKKNHEKSKKVISDDENCSENLHFINYNSLDLVNSLELDRETDQINCTVETNQILHQHLYTNSNFCQNGTGDRIGTEKKSCESDVIKYEGPHNTLDFTISEKNKSEIRIAQKKETEKMIRYDEGDWVIIPSVTDCTHFKEAHSFQPEIKAKVIGSTHESKKTNDEIFYNINLENFEAGGNLEVKNVKGSDSFTSLQKTISDSISSLINFNIFSVSSHTTPENKADDKTQTAEESEKSDDNTFALKESKINKNTAPEKQFEWKPIKEDERNYKDPLYSSYFAHSVAEECKLREEQKEKVNRMFSDDESENISPFRNNNETKINEDKNTKNEPDAIEHVNPVSKKDGGKIFSVKDLNNFGSLNIEIQTNPKNINAFDDASETVLVFKELNFTEECSEVVTGYTESDIQQRDLQNEKYVQNYSSLDEIQILDEANRAQMKTNLNGEIETNGDFDNTACAQFIPFSKTKCEKTSDKFNVTKHRRGNSVSKNFEIRDHDIKTLEDALNYFKLSPLIEQLEISLEDVRRGKKNKEAHEMFLKDVDKQIQKLSFKFHPDRVRNKGSSEEEIKTAQELQAAINAVRIALNILNDAFLEDIDTDHKYGFYTKLNLSSLANENELKSHIYEVLFQIGLLSEIKQQKIILEIQKFLTESQCCIESYVDCNACDFEKHRDSALYHLKSCIKGFKKLQGELMVIENECKAEKLDNIGCTISRMAAENRRTLTHLRDLKRVAKNSLAGSFQIYTTSEILDEYFILPFVYYVNVMLMCSVMNKNESSRLGNSALKSPSIDFEIFKINGISFAHPYLLVLSFIDDSSDIRSWLFKEKMSKEELKEEFDKYLACLYSHLKDTFKECYYKDSSMKNYLSEELKKCMKMMSDFQMKEKELSKNIEKFKKKTEEKDEKYEKIMKQNEELNKVVKEQLEKSKKLAEQTSLALSGNF